MDLVGGVPPLPPGACRRVAAWASALPALSRAWPEHAVGRLGAALAALLQPGEPHFRPVALALPPPRDFLDFCVSGSMRLEAALLWGLESSTAFAQALATFEALAFPPEAEGAPRPPVPERGALVAVGRACGPVAALQQPRRPGNVAAFVEDAGPGRAAWLLALLGEAVVHRAALRGGRPAGRGGRRDAGGPRRRLSASFYSTCCSPRRAGMRAWPRWPHPSCLPRRDWSAPRKRVTLAFLLASPRTLPRASWRG